MIVAESDAWRADVLSICWGLEGPGAATEWHATLVSDSANTRKFLIHFKGALSSFLKKAI